MEPERTGLDCGSSLPVPCVQELAKETTATVPSRYVRSDQDTPNISYSTACLPQVPVIDMQKLFSPEFMDSELEKLHHASKEWGFFQSFQVKVGNVLQLINHGVSTSLLEKIKLDIQEFFKLPMEEKKKYWQKPGELEGFGQAFVVSDEQKLDWGDMFALVTLPTHSVAPKLPLPFSENLEAYSAELQNLAMKILELMAKALRMENNEMNNLFEDGWQTIRMNYYPPCPQLELVIGLNTHSDTVGLTILLQLNEMEGLQIRKDGMWIPVIPLPNAFVVNIGDILEIVTNGIYRSIEHRATVNSAKERLSMATFYNPKVEVDLGPAPSFITPESPALFQRIGVAEYFKRLSTHKLDGKAYIDALRIQNEEQKGF
ncbi:protein SRG1-like [Corylus avellana]|uniref:protein SRG1-like n=1 Tax=Corylus avellana TaxID=13451 RepID=UPI00286C9084|nr:protein SRG1-like [Corylus avellana]